MTSVAGTGLGWVLPPVAGVAGAVRAVDPTAAVPVAASGSWSDMEPADGWASTDPVRGCGCPPAGSAAYLAVVVVAGALMLGSTGWVLAGGPPALALPLFLLGLVLSVSQLVWAGRRRRRAS